MSRQRLPSQCISRPCGTPFRSQTLPTAHASSGPLAVTEEISVPASWKTRCHVGRAAFAAALAVTAPAGPAAAKLRIRAVAVSNAAKPARFGCDRITAHSPDGMYGPAELIVDLAGVARKVRWPLGICGAGQAASIAARE